ncbi:MAG TPA: cbb3-type cytochrome oxidase assembly protein CcoS [Eoetvoesiella sp.]
MEGALLLLLPISLIFVIAVGAFFWWATFAGQFDDGDDPGESILHDNDTPDE